MLRRRSQCLVLTAAVILTRVGSAQSVTPQWQLVHLNRVPTTHDDSAVVYKSPIVVLGDRQGTAVIRYTVDNPCDDKVRLRVRSRVARTLEVQPVRRSYPYARGCLGVVSLQTYTGALAGLRAGPWRVARHSLPYPIADFTVK